MTDLAAGVLRLRPVNPSPVPHWTGRALQAWFLGCVSQHDPALAAEIHDGQGVRPYTVSSLLGVDRWGGARPVLNPQETYGLRITTLHTELTRLWFDRILPTLPGDRITLDEAELSIEGADADNDWAGRTTDADIFQQRALLADPLRRVELTFDSPTAFKSKDGPTIPFPAPGHVFGSLLDRWNTFAGLKLHPDTRRFAEACIGANRYQLETRYIEFETKDHRSAVTGCVGRCRYVILRQDRYWQGVIHALAAFAFYAGAGVHTTIGLGRLRLHEA
jgi:CRISPR-associated endoribonuclease Cas6